MEMDNELTMPADTDKGTDKGAPAAPGFSSTASTTLQQINLSIKVLEELYGVSSKQAAVLKNKPKIAELELICKTWETATEQVYELSKEWSMNVPAITDSKEIESIGAALNALQATLARRHQAHADLLKKLVELRQCSEEPRAWEPQGSLYLNGFLSILLFLGVLYDMYNASDSFIQCHLLIPNNYITWSTLSGYFVTFVMMKLKPLNNCWYTISCGILYAFALGELFVFPFWLGLSEPMIGLITDQPNLNYCSATLFQILPHLHWYKAFFHLLGIASVLFPRAEFLRRESYKAKPYTELINTFNIRRTSA